MSPTNDGKSPVYDVKNPVTDQGSRVVVYKALHTIKRPLHIPETILDAKFAWVFLCVCRIRHGTRTIYSLCIWFKEPYI